MTTFLYFNVINVTNVILSIIPTSKETMKAMSKSELAQKTGVSVKVLMRWCQPFRSELEPKATRPEA